MTGFARAYSQPRSNQFNNKKLAYIPNLLPETYLIYSKILIPEVGYLIKFSATPITNYPLPLLISNFCKSAGATTPFSVIIPVIKSAGVTSKAGL